MNHSTAQSRTGDTFMLEHKNVSIQSVQSRSRDAQIDSHLIRSGLDKSRGERGTAVPFAGIVDVATISPQTRTGRTQAMDTIRPGPRTVRDHAQSTQMAASMNCQRQRTQTVHSQSAVAYADRSRTRSERKLSTSANSPRSCSVRANGRVHEQPLSATKHGLGLSVNRQRQRA
ncbi:MAG: hypothetical protein DME23_07465 [Verrucomicrobia bacterium]|nr:MAG: hypothetical protein DME23_07465 [Verrucomicrobiota bacterium]